MNEILVEQAQHHNVRTRTEFKRNNVKAVYKGTYNLTFLGPRIWEILQDSIKKNNNLKEFRLKTKLWNPENCPCMTCKRFLPRVGFL